MIGNLYKTTRARLRQAYRNRNKNQPTVKTDAQGNVRRGEGRNNFQYGPQTTSPSILAIRRKAERPRKYGACSTREKYEAMTRDELRAVAKEKGLTGYGKMNKEALIEAVLSR